MRNFVMQVFCGHRKAHMLASLPPPPRVCCTSHLLPQPFPSALRQENSDVVAPGIMFYVRRGQRKWVWCVSDRSPGSAAGEHLSWAVWSWKLSRSHWKWLLPGTPFIFVYLLFLKPFLKSFFFNKWVLVHELCVYLFLQEHLCMSISFFLSLQGKVVTFWCRLWTLMKHHLSWEGNVCSNSGEHFLFLTIL